MNDLAIIIEETAVIPVAVIEDPAKAAPLARALCEGGLKIIEVTFRTQGAAECIRRIAENVPEMMVAAGTVRTPGQVDDAIDAGAKFIVSPGFSPKVVSRCLEQEIPVVPGCITPTEIEQASEYGLKILKFFPAEAAGGVKMLKAFADVYSGIRFMPTGGISPANLKEYLSLPNVIACGGSWMVKKTVVEAGDFDKIRRDAAECVRLAADIR